MGLFWIRGKVAGWDFLLFICLWMGTCTLLEYLLRSSECLQTLILSSWHLSLTVCKTFSFLYLVSCVSWHTAQGLLFHSVSLMQFESINKIKFTLASPILSLPKRSVPGGRVCTYLPTTIVSLVSSSHFHVGKLIHNSVDSRPQFLNFEHCPKYEHMAQSFLVTSPVSVSSSLPKEAMDTALCTVWLSWVLACCM